MDIEKFIMRMRIAIGEAHTVNLDALRKYTEIEDIRYIQGVLDTLDDMSSRISSEYTKLNKETLLDEDE